MTLLEVAEYFLLLLVVLSANFPGNMGDDSPDIGSVCIMVK